MKDALRSSWPLLLGIAFIMVGNGLQSSLLGVRAGVEGFGSVAIGVVMSSFYVGFLAGSAATPRLVASVGHIRVFAAWASLASAAVLLHSLWPAAPAWAVMRFATGFAYAGMYVIAESWLNDRADNSARGQLLSLYMVVQYSGIAMGQLLLNLADPVSATLFIVVSVLVSLALIPISLSSRPAPLFGDTTSVPLLELLRITPTGLIGCGVAGAMTGVILSMGTVYAQAVGMDVGKTSIFMVVAIVGGALLQFPLGRLSDLIWRTDVIIAACAVGCGACLAVPAARWFALPGSLEVLAFGVVGALLLPVHALTLALANDRLRPEQMLAAGSGLVLAYGMGAALGPFSVGAAMYLLGPPGFFWVLAFLAAALSVGGLLTRHRSNQGKTEFLATPVSSPHTPELLAETEALDVAGGSST
jgi:MFS family permease